MLGTVAGAGDIVVGKQKLPAFGANIPVGEGPVDKQNQVCLSVL